MSLQTPPPVDAAEPPNNADAATVELDALPASAFTDTDAATAEWAATAHVVAAAGAMRQVSYTGKKASYRPRDQRLLTDRLPRVAAAVMLFDTNARLHCLAFDLDAKGNPRELVRHESVGLAALLRSCGFGVWIDESPSGGRHVYARTATPISAIEVRTMARALRQRYSTLDIAPLSNAGHGCIRPTGSPHPSGGYQRRVTPDAHYHRALTEPPCADAWARLKLLIPALPEPATVSHDDDAEPVLDLRGPAIAGWAERIAVAGPPEGRYPSDSHARIAIAGAAARAGWTVGDYQRAIRARWHWLRASYQRKGRDVARAAAYDFTKSQSNAAAYRESARTSDTSHGSTRAGGTETVNIEIRRWINHAAATGRACPRGSYSPLKQAVVRSLGVFALLQGRRFVNGGVRGYAIQAAAGHDSVSRILHELADDGLIWRVSSGHGIEADVWALNLEGAANSKPWRGKLNGTRAVFRVLGGWQVAEVYEQLITNKGVEQSSAELARAIGRAKSTVDEALATMAAWKLAENSPKLGWVIGSADPGKLSAHLGADVLEADQLTRYKEHRAAWRHYLQALPALRRAEQGMDSQAQTLWDLETAAIPTDETEWWLLHDPPARADRETG